MNKKFEITAQNLYFWTHISVEMKMCMKERAETETLVLCTSFFAVLRIFAYFWIFRIITKCPMHLERIDSIAIIKRKFCITNVIHGINNEHP